MTAAVATKLEAADWTSDTKEALAAVEALYQEALASVRARDSRDGKIANDLFEADQHAAHGLAWLATYVQGPRELIDYAERLSAEGAYGETEELLNQIGFAEFLDVRPTDDLIVQSLPVSTNMVEPSGSLKLPAFLVYFGLLFVVLRWWTQADPLRNSRLSLWATGGCVLWAWIWHMIWPFPQPWGFMLAATVSVAVQLSAPWMSPKERKRIRHQMNEA